jgi:hypothetical protein
MTTTYSKKLTTHIHTPQTQKTILSEKTEKKDLEKKTLEKKKFIMVYRMIREKLSGGEF